MQYFFYKKYLSILDLKKKTLKNFMILSICKKKENILFLFHIFRLYLAKTHFSL
jgi:hypothetical protein